LPSPKCLLRNAASAGLLAPAVATRFSLSLFCGLDTFFWHTGLSALASMETIFEQKSDIGKLLCYLTPKNGREQILRAYLVSGCVE
jgi:hypothetical protein